MRARLFISMDIRCPQTYSSSLLMLPSSPPPQPLEFYKPHYQRVVVLTARMSTTTSQVEATVAAQVPEARPRTLPGTKYMYGTSLRYLFEMGWMDSSIFEPSPSPSNSPSSLFFCFTNKLCQLIISSKNKTHRNLLLLYQNLS